jgi:EARP and GARP complex-interacting protein 1
MYTTAPVEVVLPGGPCRTAAALPGSSSHDNDAVSRFIVSAGPPLRGHGDLSNAATHAGQLHILHYTSDAHELTVHHTFSHDTGAVAALQVHPRASLSYSSWSNGDDDDSATADYVLLTASERSSQATLWKCSTTSSDLESLAVLRPTETSANMVDLAWRSPAEHLDDSEPASSGHNDGCGDIVMMDAQGRVTQWDLSNGSAQCIRTDTALTQTHSTSSSSNSIMRTTPPLCPKVRWDPHGNGHTLAATYGSWVHLLDWRFDTTIPLGTVSSFATRRRCSDGSTGDSLYSTVTDLSYNPHQPYVLATASTEGTMHLWDLRATRRPRWTARGGHSHWVTRVQYNPHHDQLMVTTGTDGIANLWRMSSLSSAPLFWSSSQSSQASQASQQDWERPRSPYSSPRTRNPYASDTEHHNHHQHHHATSPHKDMDPARSSSAGSPNMRVTRYEQGESIYGACWSAHDPWIYLTVSYDGKAVLHPVPSKEKYKILL